MALSLFEFTAVFVLFVNFGTALHIEMTPQTLYEKTTKELNITCRADGPTYWAKHVVTLNLAKRGQKPLALYGHDGLTMGLDVTKNMKADGHLEIDARKGFLRLTIQNPSKKDAGTYECRMSYVDEWLQMKEVKAEANLTFARKDIETIVTSLVERVSILEETIHDQREIIQEQGEVILNQTDKLQKQEALLQQQQVLVAKQERVAEATVSNINDSVSVLRSRIEKTLGTVADQKKDQNMKLKDQNMKLKDQDMKLKGQDMKLKDQDMKLKDQDMKLKDQDMKLKDQDMKLKDQEMKLKDQDMKLKGQSMKLQDQETKLKDQDVKLKDQEETNKNQMKLLQNFERKMERQVMNLKLQQEKIQEKNKIVISQMDELFSLGKNHTAALEDLVRKESVTSAFFALYDDKAPVSKGQILLFPEVLENSGNDFDKGTGIYTAPVDGLYTFHLFALSYSKGRETYINVLANERIMAALLVEHLTDTYDQSSVSVVVRLKAKDTVKCQVSFANTKNNRFHRSIYTGFTGYLVKTF